MARPERKDADIIEFSKARAKEISFGRSHFCKKFKRSSISLKTKIAVIGRDRPCCVQCEIRLKIRYVSKRNLSIKDGTFHHIIPLIYGGPNIIENICLLCSCCHNKVHSGRETDNKYYDMFECYVLNNRLWGYE